MTRNEGIIRRFGEIELRIGNNDESGLGIAHFRFNPLVGYYPGYNTDPVASFGPLPSGQGARQIPDPSANQQKVP